MSRTRIQLATFIVTLLLGGTSSATSVDLLGVQEGGKCRAVSTDGANAWLGFHRVLVGFDATAPASPVRISSMLLPDPINGLDLAGDYVFAAVGASGLCIVDVTNPSSPSEVTSLPLAGSAKDVTVAGTLAYVAAGGAGLRVVDVATVSSPTEIGHWDTPGTASAVFASGSYVYIADAAGGLRIIDVSTPGTPSEEGCLVTAGDVVDVFVQGDYAYVCDASIGLRVINVANKALPSEEGSESVSSPGAGVVVSGSSAYVLGGSFNVIDVTDPSNPTWQSNESTGIGDPDDVVLIGSHAYVANGSGGLAVIDVTGPTKVAAKEAWDDARGLFLADGLAYVSSDHDQLQIIDISGSAPAFAGRAEWGLTSQPYGTAVRKAEYCYVGSVGGNGWYIWDVSNPSTPAYVGSNGDPAAGVQLDAEISGNYIYAAKDNYGLRVYDINTPTVPFATGYFATSARCEAVEIGGTVAYLSNGAPGAGFHVLDITNPSSVSEITSMNTPGTVRDLALSGDYLYVADEGLAVTVFDVSNPALPSTVVQLPAFFGATDLAVTNDILYVFDANFGITAIDVSEVGISPDPLPVLGTYLLDEFGETYMRGDNGRAVLVDQLVGLMVFEVSGPSAADEGPSLRSVVLHQNQPNPFTRTTRIRFDAPASAGGHIAIDVYDIAGRHVRTLFSDAAGAGERSVTWDGLDATGRPVASGVYFCRMTGSGISEVRKMTLVR